MLIKAFSTFVKIGTSNCKLYIMKRVVITTFVLKIEYALCVMFGVENKLHFVLKHNKLITDGRAILTAIEYCLPSFNSMDERKNLNSF